VRKKIEVTINDTESRDNGKTYIIEEMPAFQAENWCYKALGAIIRSGVDGLENILDYPSEQMAILGLAALLRTKEEELMPLMHELMSCVSFKVESNLQPKDVSAPIKINRRVTDFYLDKNYVDIEEISTLIKLRAEVFKLHLGFLKAVKDMIFQNYIGQKAG